ncbi:MAG: TasA family protein [Halococcoides sp.]
MSEDSSGFDLTRRHVLGGLAATGAAAGLGAGGTTMALLSDTESIEDNRIEAGTLDLTLQDEESWAWKILGVAPGSPKTVTQDLQFLNTGTVAADHLSLDLSNETFEDDDGDPSNGYTPGPESDPETGSDGADGMAAFVTIDGLQYETADGTKQPFVARGSAVDEDLTDTNDNGRIDLEDLAAPANAAVLEDLPAPPANGAGATTVTIEMYLDEATPNRYQGDIVESTLTAELTQADSQD